MDNDKQEKNLVSNKRKDKKAQQDRPSVSILIPGIRFPLRILFPPNNAYMSQANTEAGVDGEEKSGSQPSSPVGTLNSLKDDRSPLSVSPSGSVDISKLLIESLSNRRRIASGQVNTRRRSRSRNRKKNDGTFVEEGKDEIVVETPEKSEMESYSMTKMHIKSSCTRNQLYQDGESRDHGHTSTTNLYNSIRPRYLKTATASPSSENIFKELNSTTLKGESQSGISSTSETGDDSIIKEGSTVDGAIPIVCLADLKKLADQSESSNLGSSLDGESSRILVDASVLTINAADLDRSDTCCQTDKSTDIHCRSVQTFTTESKGVSQNTTIQDSPNKSGHRSNHEKMTSKNSCDDKKVTKTRRLNVSGGKSNDKRRTSANVPAENSTDKDKGNKTQEANTSSTHTNKPEEGNVQLPKKRENANKGNVVKSKQNRNDVKHKKNSPPVKACSIEKTGVNAENTEQSGVSVKREVTHASEKLVEPSKRKSNESIGIRIIHVNNNYEESPYIDDSETMRTVSLHDVGRTSEEKLHLKDLFSESLQMGATGIVIQDATTQKVKICNPEPVKHKKPRFKPQEAGCSKKEESHRENPKSPESQSPRVTNVRKSSRRRTKPDIVSRDFKLIEEMKRILSVMWAMVYYFWTTYV